MRIQSWVYKVGSVYRLLFQSKDVVVEELVQLFVCKVDTELLERVCL